MAFAEWLLDPETHFHYGPEMTRIMIDKVESGAFLEEIETRTNGDDFLFWVSAMFDGFDLIQFIKAAGKHGYIVTPANKTGKPEAYKDISECTYLKRSFRKEMGEMFAPMAEEEIDERSNWVSKKMDPYIALQQNIHDIIQEYFHHGRAIFDVKKAYYNGILTNNDLKVYTKTYDYLLNKYVENSTAEIEEELGEVHMQMLKQTHKGVILDCSSLSHLFSKLYDRVPAITIDTIPDSGYFSSTLTEGGKNYGGLASSKAQAKERALVEFFKYHKNMTRENAWNHLDPNKSVTFGPNSTSSFWESVISFTPEGVTPTIDYE
jgi:hypothetical protein